MSPALCLFQPCLPICTIHDLKNNNSHPFITPYNTNRCPGLHLNTKLNRRDLLNTVGLTFIGGAVVQQPARAEVESTNDASSSRMSYSRFLQYLDAGAVKKADLFENGTVAIAEIMIPELTKSQRVKIQLPGLPQELLRKLKEKDVDFAAHPIEMTAFSVFLDLLGNLAFPLLLIGSLLLRTPTNLPGGGSNLPFGLGRYVALHTHTHLYGICIPRNCLPAKGTADDRKDYCNVNFFICKTPKIHVKMAVIKSDITSWGAEPFVLKNVYDKHVTNGFFFCLCLQE